MFVRKEDGDYWHWCAGCKTTHAIAVDEPLPNGARWSFDGNRDRPTFAPSVNIGWGDPPGSLGRCHYTITAGRVKFHGDTSHELRGQTVDLPSLPVGHRGE